MSNGFGNSLGGFSDREVGSVVVTCSTELILRLLLYRGTKQRDINCNAELFSSKENLDAKSPFLVIDKTKIGSGKLEVKKPTSIVPKAEWVKITYLDANYRKTNEGLIVKLEVPKNISRPDAAAERLRMLAFYEQAALTESAAGDLAEQKYLDFFLALGLYMRSAKEEEEIGEFEALSWASLDEKEYWDYRYNDHYLPDPEFDGELTDKEDVFRLKLLRGDGESSGRAYVRVGEHITPDVEIKNGAIEIKVPKRLAPKMKRARLYYLNEDGDFNGRGLSVKLESADTSKAPIAAQRLGSLGFYHSALPDEGSVSALKEQDYLNIFLASGAWVRSQKDGAQIIDTPGKILEAGLDKDDYWQYEHHGYNLPDPEFDGELSEKEDIFRLKLLRGDGKSSGRAYVRVGEHITPDAEIKNGTIEIKVPKRLAPKMKQARLYYLNADGDFNGRGLSVKLESADISKAPIAAQRLGSLGFYHSAPPGEGSVSALKEQDYLNIFLASGAWVRSQKDGAQIDAPVKITAGLDKDDYWQYEHHVYSLPSLEFDGELPESEDVFRLKLLRGEGKLSGRAYVRVGEHITPDVEIKNGAIEIKVPKRLAHKMKRARLYYLNEDGDFNGRGLSVKLESADISKAPIAAQRLGSLGFYPSVPPREDSSALKDQDYPDFFLASAAWARSQNDDSKIIDPAKVIDAGLDKDAYWQYEHQSYKLPDSEFAGELPEKEDVFRLKLLRGDGKSSGRAYVRVGEHIIPDVEIKNGTIEIKVPKRLAPKMKRARLYYLNADGDFNGRGLSVKLESADISKAPIAAQRLASLGFYHSASPGEGSVSALKERDYLNIFLASSTWVRSQKDGAQIIDAPGKILEAGLDKDDYWQYEHQGYKLPDPDFGGELPEKEDVFRLNLLRGEGKLSGRAYVRVGEHVIPDAEIKNGIIEIQVPKRLASKMKRARLYYLNEDGDFNGRGLSVKLESADISKAPIAAQRLGSLGFYQSAPLGEASSALKDQDYPDFFLASAAWARSQNDDSKIIDPAKVIDAGLDKDDYWQYEDQGYKLPDPEFGGELPEKEDVFRLKLLRGEGELSGRAYVIAGEHVIPDAEVKNGIIEIKVPKRLAPKMKRARLYYLNEDGDFSGSGLSVKLESADTSKAPIAAQRLGSLGFYHSAPPGEGSVSALKEQDYLDFFLASAHWVKSKSKDEEKAADNGAVPDLLDRDDYWLYQPNNHKLSDPDFTGGPAKYTSINLRLNQTIEKGVYEVASDYNLTKIEVQNSASSISVNVPSRLASKIKRARIYELGRQGESYDYIEAARV